MEKTFKILSFCGGGIRGLISAQILDRLNVYYTKTAGSDESLNETGDLFAGTSTGAIITNLLINGLTIEELRDFYHYIAPVLFSFKNHDPSRPEYDTAKTIDFLTRKVPKLNLSRTFGDLPAGKHALMTSFTVSKDTPQSPGDTPTWGPVLFHNMQVGSDNHRWRGTPKVSTFYAAMCSGAMPGMMGSIDIPQENFIAMVDGAFLHHDPTLAAISTAVASGINLEDITVIDIGTGLMPQFISDVKPTTNWGIQQYMEHKEVPASNMQPLFVNWNRQQPVMNMTLNGTSTDMVPSLAQMLLGDRYVYLNPTLSKPIAEDDTDPKALKEMMEAANDLDLSKAEDLLLKYWCGKPSPTAGQSRAIGDRTTRPH